MKNLLYKEFRLSVHPLAYFIMALLCSEALSPKTPVFASIIFIGMSYLFTFIGMNKSASTNDLFYTCTLPINRKDVIKARLCTLTVFQIISLVLICSFAAINNFIFIPGMIAAGKTDMMPQFSVDMHQGLWLLGSFLIAIVVYDLIYLPWYYSNGKSLILNTLCATIGCTITIAILTIVPFFTFNDLITVGGPNANYFLQVGFLVFAIAIWIGSKFLLTKICTKKLKKLDF